MKMRAKRILSMALVFCLCLTMLPSVTMKVAAATPGYTVSSSYKASSYYSALCNVTLTGNQRTDIVNIALSQVGYREGSYSGDYGGADDGSYNNYTEYNYWYHNYVSSGMPVGGDSAPWCATFVSWCAEQANIPSSILKRSTAAGHGASYFNVKFYSGSSTLASSGDNDSYFMGYNYTPKAGDLFFTRSWSHVGLVVAVNGSYVITVEGNTNTNGSSQGNGVYKLTSRKIADLYFGVPDYTNTSVKHTVDSRYSAYFPIAAYPISTDHISVYDAAGTIYSNRYIDGATDICIIWEIYTDGWCKVRYPSSAEASGYFDAYVPLSVFTSASAPTSWVAENDYITYKRSDMESSMHSVSSGSTGLLLKTDGYLKQIIHPVSGQSYYMMGWIAEPKQIHSSATFLTLTLGGTSSQTIYAWSTGYYDGNTALYYSRSNSNISCSWGEWTDGKAPLTITASSAGTTTLTLGVKDSDTDTVLDSMTVTITVSAKSYTVSYNANGGSGAPGSQTKYYNTTLTLSSTKPTRTGYTFLGWSTSSSATSATYQPGGSFTSNANTTLYAVWKQGCEGSSHKYVYNVTEKPTSTSTGKIVGECGYCGATTSVLLPKLNTDDYTYKVTKVATCTATGTGRYTWNTTSYGGSYYFDETIPATGHSYSYKATKAPTTSATGTLTGTCSKCSGTTAVTLPKLSTTDYNYSVRTAATCTIAGSGRYTWKTTTYGSFYFDVSIAASGHNYSNGSCTRCGAEDPVSSYDACVYTEAKKTVVQGSQFTYTVSLAGTYDGFSFEIASGNDLTVTDIITTNSNINIDKIGDKWMVSVLGGLAKTDAEKEELVTVTVQVASDAELGARTLTLSNFMLSSESGDKVSAIKYEYASIEITDQIPGDINGDGTFDYYDVSKLYAYYRNKTTLSESVDTDINGDGGFDYYDVSKLYAIYRGKANFN